MLLPNVERFYSEFIYQCVQPGFQHSANRTVTGGYKSSDALSIFKFDLFREEGQKKWCNAAIECTDKKAGEDVEMASEMTASSLSPYVLLTE